MISVTYGPAAVQRVSDGIKLPAYYLENGLRLTAESLEKLDRYMGLARLMRERKQQDGRETHA